MKHLALGIGLCTGTIFAAENGRVIKFENKSGRNLEVFYTNPHGIQSYLFFNHESFCNKAIAQNKQNVVVTWQEQNMQHKFSLKYRDPAVVILPAIAIRFTQPQNFAHTTFLTSDLSITHTHVVPAIKSHVIISNVQPKSESSSSSSEDDDNVPPQILPIVPLLSESSSTSSSESSDD